MKHVSKGSFEDKFYEECILLVQVVPELSHAEGNKVEGKHQASYTSERDKCKHTNISAESIPITSSHNVSSRPRSSDLYEEEKKNVIVQLPENPARRTNDDVEISTVKAQIKVDIK